MSTHFFGFSPESFEQFARVLALSVFGPGVSTFGNGPDGGREAIFRGEVPYPFPPASQWSGYGVIQAKCKEKAESTGKDQAWALNNLETELKTFVKSQKRNPKPDYYVFVTNVELSSVAGGGRDQADELVRSYYNRLALRDHAIWDSNQLTAFLGLYEGIRKTFTAYLTPGDVLAEILAKFEQRKPQSLRLLTAFLEKELRADEAARLDQAGNRTDEQLRLARLFFDIPVSGEPQLTAPDEKLDENGRLPHGVLNELLRAGSRRLDSTVVYEQELETAPKSNRIASRYVLLGGPGSGKSTVGQFLAQIYRAALLERRPPQTLLFETRKIVKETHDLCARDDLPWPATPRYPFRIELNRFAKALASKGSGRSVGTLSGYLLSELSGDEVLEHSDLLEVLGKYPWLLILDGLDEVPATSNRDAVVAAVNDFLAITRQVGADLFVVATSRQQGYAGEFAAGVVAFRHMLPLSTARAVRYVERYAGARYGATDPNRAKDVINHVRQSAGNQLTAQLMSSPLQVTFMATVIAARGDPGQNRWQLFDNYYRTIYERELQKAVPPYDEILSRYQAVIDRLHHDIGFWLQFAGETARGMAVSLPIANYERLVQAYLSELGHEGADGASLVRRIVDAARHRLVFLTSRTEGELSFDVRSLQEYMASECLMTGTHEIVRARLRSIAPAAYWRNVFLFAASKCFADTRTRHLQDSVRLLCVDLSIPSDGALGVVRAGAELALDVLQGGALAENLNYARQLAAIALELAERPSTIEESREGASSDRRITLAYRPALQSTYEPRLKLLIGQMEIDRSLGAWPIVLRLIGTGVQWAVSLAQDHWPADTTQQWKILQPLASELMAVPWIGAKLAQLMPALRPSELFGFLYTLRPGQFPSPQIGALAELLQRPYGGQSAVVNVTDWPFTLQFTSMNVQDQGYRDALEAVAHMPRANPFWLPVIRCAEFVREPDHRVLAQILSECADAGCAPADSQILHILPWPLAKCLLWSQTKDDLRRLAEAARTGLLGSTADWLEAEARWNSEGVSLAELSHRSPCGLPFDTSIGKSGWGGELYILTNSTERLSAAAVNAFLSVFEGWPIEAYQDSYLFTLSRVLYSAPSSANVVEANRLRALLEKYAEAAGDEIWWADDFVPYKRHLGAERTEQWVEFFDWLGRSELMFSGYPLNVINRVKEIDEEGWITVWQKAFVRDPTRVGLLRLLSHQAADGRPVELIPEGMLRVEAFDTPKYKFAALLLLLTRPKQSTYDAARLARIARELLDCDAERDGEEVLLRAVGRYGSGMEEFLLGLHSRTSAGNEAWLARLERLLRQNLRRRSSHLQTRGQLDQLQLPEVTPLSSS